MGLVSHEDPTWGEDKTVGKLHVLSPFSNPLGYFPIAGTGCQKISRGIFLSP